MFGLGNQNQTELAGHNGVERDHFSAPSELVSDAFYTANPLAT